MQKVTKNVLVIGASELVSNYNPSIALWGSRKHLGVSNILKNKYLVFAVVFVVIVFVAVVFVAVVFVAVVFVAVAWSLGALRGPLGPPKGSFGAKTGPFGDLGGPEEVIY